MDIMQPAQPLLEARQSLTRQEIHFPNGHTALAVTVPPTASSDQVIKALGIQKPKALILVIGGASNLEESLNARLKLLSNLGIARVAAEEEALIIDGGTQAGIMAMMGQGVAERGYKTPLLGVAPADLVTFPGRSAHNSQTEHTPLDPNHSHFALAGGDKWGDETNLMYQLAAELSKGKEGKRIPLVTILVNGGKIARHEAWHSVQEGWPIIVIEGSGRSADEIATVWRKQNEQQGQRKKRTSFGRSQNKNTEKDVPAILDPELTEIIEQGDIHLFPLEGPSEQLEKLLKQLLHRSDILSHAWQLFALYDANAKRQQKSFLRLQAWILRIGVLATAVVVTQVLLKQTSILTTNASLNWIIHYTIVLLPIIVSILIAGTSRFTPGNKWILLRASAEAIKREIYRYRTETGEYKKEVGPSTVSPDDQKRKLTPQEKFTEKISGISRHLMQTEINLAALQPYNGPIPPVMDGAEAKDDGYSKLSPGHYMAIRIGDQLIYFRGKSIALAKQLKIFYWLIFIASGTGALLAALGLEPVVALTGALAAAFASYLEYRQVQYTLIKYNQTASSLNNAKHLWIGLPQNRHTESFDQLVSTTEQILETENIGWVQQMQDALTELRNTQEKIAKSDSPPDQKEGEQSGENNDHDNSAS